jgi:hypothetical protein
MMTHASANGTGVTYFYYKCNRKSRSVGEACKARDVPAPAAEKFVLGELRKMSMDVKAVKAAVRRTNEGRDEELKRIDAELKEKRFASQEQGRAIQKLVNAFEEAADSNLLQRRPVPALPSAPPSPRSTWAARLMASRMRT